jgi:hypothetical protein
VIQMYASYSLLFALAFGGLMPIALAVVLALAARTPAAVRRWTNHYGDTPPKPRPAYVPDWRPRSPAGLQPTPAPSGLTAKRPLARWTRHRVWMRVLLNAGPLFGALSAWWPVLLRFKGGIREGQLVWTAKRQCIDCGRGFHFEPRHLYVNQNSGVYRAPILPEDRFTRCWLHAEQLMQSNERARDRFPFVRMPEPPTPNASETLRY